MSKTKSIEDIIADALTPSPVWTLQQYQDIFSCSEATVRRRIADKTITPVKIGPRTYIVKESVLKRIRAALEAN